MLRIIVPLLVQESGLIQEKTTWGPEFWTHKAEKRWAWMLPTFTTGINVLINIPLHVFAITKLLSFTCTNNQEKCFCNSAQCSRILCPCCVVTTVDKMGLWWNDKKMALYLKRQGIKNPAGTDSQSSSAINGCIWSGQLLGNLHLKSSGNVNSKCHLLLQAKASFHN